MRNGQNKRMRGRNNNRRNQNPLSRVYESNGPDVKIRGTASHVAEKYIQLARDAQSSGDPIAAENYYQHAEHYFRLIAAAQEQFRQQNPHYQQNQQPQQGGGAPQGNDDGYDDVDDDSQPQHMGQNEPYSPQQPQPYLPREGQPFPQRDHQQQYAPREQQHGGGGGGRQQYHQQHQQPHYNAPQPQASEEVGGLPSFITGGQQPQQGQQPGSNGHDNNQYDRGGDRNQDRFPLHRRRRRHRGPRPDFQNAQGGGNDGGSDEPPHQPE
ncbi:MAG TPA: DUF4167 domain-containing protein [Pseudolabrys sp.]|nr:DUF4167 domain-containing protein [Pseudolabrys sp.]